MVIKSFFESATQADPPQKCEAGAMRRLKISISIILFKQHFKLPLHDYKTVDI